MKRAYLIAALGLLVLTLAACGNSVQTPTPDPGPADPTLPAPDVTSVPTQEPATSPTQVTVSGVSFSADVLPIFQANCTRCHGTSRQSADLMLNTYNNVLAGGEDGLVVIAGDPVNSLLVQVISDGSMPKNGQKLSSEDIQTIQDWILAGAPEN